MSSLRSYLRFTVGEGWMDESVLQACFSVPDSNPRREWLHPEQLDAISTLVELSEELADYEKAGFGFLRDYGVRTDEAIRMRAHHLDPRAKLLKVVGKGRGEGKERSIPADDAMIERWRAHIDAHAIRRDGYMLFHRATRFVGGSNEEYEWILDRSRPSSAKLLRRVMTVITDLAERELEAELIPHFALIPKVMRRTFACTQLILHALNLGGMDIRTLQKAMRHERLDTTQRYLADAEEYIGSVKRHVNTRDGARLIAELRKSLDRQS
jgi:site-specific recombinase XerD